MPDNNTKPKWRGIKLKNSRVFSRTDDGGTIILVFAKLIPIDDREYYNNIAGNECLRVIKRNGVPVIRVTSIVVGKEAATAITRLIMAELCC